jgi:hypothetical protein
VLRVRAAIPPGGPRSACQCEALRPAAAGSGKPRAVMSWVCKLPDARGKFDVQRARALGVRPGPDFGRLVAGHTVTTAGGKHVQVPPNPNSSPSPEHRTVHGRV